MKKSFAISSLLAASLFLTACGGGGGGAATSTAAASAPASAASAVPTVDNTLAVVVDGGPLVNGQPVGTPNVAYVSVRVCVPGSATACQTIDHVQLDTGSTGLRLLASALTSDVSLPAALDSNGKSLAECTRFAGGTTWGAVRLADVHLAGESAGGIPVQIIGDGSVLSAPIDCGGGNPTMNDVSELSAKGILGVGNAVVDCSDGVCAAQGAVLTYYDCVAATCTGVALPASRQVSNPVASFTQDNNGTIVRLPAVGADGAPSVAGTLVFGIGTQGNNGLGSATVLTVDPVDGTFTTVYHGRSYLGFIDSGSNATTFDDDAIPKCAQAAGFYCPGTTLSLSAVNTGRNGASTQVDFRLADFATLYAVSASNLAFDDVATTTDGNATLAGTFDWGLPFFFGRSVYTAIEGRMAAGTMGPYVAY